MCRFWPTHAISWCVLGLFCNCHWNSWTNRPRVGAYESVCVFWSVHFSPQERAIEIVCRQIRVAPMIIFPETWYNRWKVYTIRNYTQDLPCIPIKKVIFIKLMLIPIYTLIYTDYWFWYTEWLDITSNNKIIWSRKKTFFSQLFWNVSCAFIETAQDARCVNFVRHFFLMFVFRFRICYFLFFSLLRTLVSSSANASV